MNRRLRDAAYSSQYRRFSKTRHYQTAIPLKVMEDARQFRVFIAGGTYGVEGGDE
jgi:hypothetical protein